MNFHLTLALIFSLFLCSTLGADEQDEKKRKILRNDQIALKAAVGFHATYLKTSDKRESLPGFVFAPSVSHSLGNVFELSVQGFLRFGKKQNLSFKLDDVELTGRASAYDVQISPQLKAYLPLPNKERRWRPYLSVGPSWSLYTYSYRDNNMARDAGLGVESSQYKLAYDMNGLNASIGIQEFTKYKEMHPTYIEIAYSSYRSRRVSLLDTAKFHKTNVLLERKDRSVKGHMIALIIGFTLF
jgi:hypothetical protein